MLLSLNPDIVTSIALWPNEAIVYHPYRGDTNHLDSIATEIIKLLSRNKINIEVLIKTIHQCGIDSASIEDTGQLVHAYISELSNNEIIIKC